MAKTNNISELKDEELIKLAQEEDNHPAFAMLIQRHSQKFYSLCYRYVRDPDISEEITQEAFLKLWSKKAIYNPEKAAKFTTWFYRVVSNMCLDYIKKKKPLPMMEDVQFADTSVDIEKETLQGQIEDMIATLPENQALAINLTFYEGLSNKEAADVVGVGVKALESLLMRAKKKLKELVAQGEGN